MKITEDIQLVETIRGGNVYLISTADGSIPESEFRSQRADHRWGLLGEPGQVAVVDLIAVSCWSGVGLPRRGLDVGCVEGAELAASALSSRVLEESQAEGCKHHDNADVH